jgi:hypothetical protein
MQPFQTLVSLFCMARTKEPKNQRQEKRHQDFLPFQISLATIQTLWMASNLRRNWHILDPDTPYLWEHGSLVRISGMQA